MKEQIEERKKKKNNQWFSNKSKLRISLNSIFCDILSPSLSYWLWMLLLYHLCQQSHCNKHLHPPYHKLVLLEVRFLSNELLTPFVEMIKFNSSSQQSQIFTRRLLNPKEIDYKYSEEMCQIPCILTLYIILSTIDHCNEQADF